MPSCEGWMQALILSSEILWLCNTASCYNVFHYKQLVTGGERMKHRSWTEVGASPENDISGKQRRKDMVLLQLLVSSLSAAAGLSNQSNRSLFGEWGQNLENCACLRMFITIPYSYYNIWEWITYKDIRISLLIFGKNSLLSSNTTQNNNSTIYTQKFFINSPT